MASFTFLQSTDDAANSSTYTFASQNFGATDAARRIVVCVNGRAGSAGSTISSVTIGGVSATIHVQANNGASASCTSCIASALVPSGASGSIVVTFSATMLRANVAAYRSVGYEAAASSTTTFTGASLPVSASLNVLAGGVALGTAINGGNDLGWVWTGLDEDSDGVVEFLSYTTAHKSFGTAQTPLAISVTNTGASNFDPLGVFAAFKPLAAGVVTPIIMHLLSGGQS